MFTAGNKNLCMRYTVCSLILQYAGFSYCLCYNCYISPPVDLDIIYTHWNQLKVKRPTLIIALQCTALPGNLWNHLGFQLDLIHSLKCWRPTEITKKQWRLPARGCASQIAKTAQKQLEEQVKEASAWTWTPKQSGSTSNQASVECTGTNRIHRLPLRNPQDLKRSALNLQVPDTTGQPQRSCVHPTVTDVYYCKS